MNLSIVVEQSVLSAIQNEEPFDPKLANLDSRWELFDNPPLLHTAEQNRQMIRLLRALPRTLRPVGAYNRWVRYQTKGLRMSPYGFEACDEQGNLSVVNGEFYLILQGELRGQIHGWSADGLYGCHGADRLFDWTYNSDEVLMDEVGDVVRGFLPVYLSS